MYRIAPTERPAAPRHVSSNRR